MLKLKYLIEDFNLAEMLLKHWSYDEASLDLFQYFRISSNAIYPYKCNNEVCFLRFAPTSEKDLHLVIAELEFIDYLKVSNFNSLEVLPTKEGQKIIQVQTPQGIYVATSFKRVSGEPISERPITPEIAQRIGKKLGKLHDLSSQYAPVQTNRPNLESCFEWMAQVLELTTSPEFLINELEALRETLMQLNRNTLNYGLIHYDFEPDNLFYEQEREAIHIIDFDDCMYHFYAQDLERAIHALQSETEEKDHKALEAACIEGYKKHMNLDAAIWNHRQAFERFGQLYQYCRIRYALHEPPTIQPDWMPSLIQRLEDKLTSIEMHMATTTK